MTVIVQKLSVQKLIWWFHLTLTDNVKIYAEKEN